MSAGKNKQHGKRRVSRALPLMLVTSAALTACSSDSGSSGNTELTAIRDQYKSLEDCRKDWGDGPACESVATSNLNTDGTPNNNNTNSNGYTSGGGHSGYSGYSMMHYGPSYYPGSRDTAQRSFGLQSTGSDHAISHTTSHSSSGRGGISRGGFGGTARGTSGGG
ncbi:hypothetical protein [Undibacterium sp. TJN19]|uniref:hypothetical protein n=1 Tax=Undibacterium sp. TJN19 TaxID=3413055 RepID=UPI003BF10C46